MNQIKQSNEFTHLSTTRDKASKQIAPIIEKIQTEFQIVLSEAKLIKDKANQILKFQGEKLTLQKYIKDVRRDLHETNSHLATIKAENDLGHSKFSLSLNTIKQQIHSLERAIDRREQYFQSYDKKLGNMVDTLSKHQTYINQRMYIYQDKFKQLTKQTLQISKQIKKQFDSTMIINLTLKNQLLSKIKNTQQKQKILDLYMNQRQQIPKKIKEIYQNFKNCLTQAQFRKFQLWHQSAIAQSLTKAKELIDKANIASINENVQELQLKIKQFEEVKHKTRQIPQIRQMIEEIKSKMQSAQKQGDYKIAQIREEAEEIQQKIIEVIDKKIDEVEEQFENFQVQKEQSIDEKLQKMKLQLLEIFQNRPFQKVREELTQSHIMRTVSHHQKKVENHNYTSHHDLQVIKKQKELIEHHSGEIKALAQGLNHKLSLFSNKITMCKSDIQIFVENTTKELKKIIDIRKQSELHLEQVGKTLSDLMQAVLVIISLSINQQRKGQLKSYVSYHDGIILEMEDQSSTQNISYRKCKLNSFDLKEALLLTLLNKTDELILSKNIFRWDTHKPSSFFSNIKQTLASRMRPMSRSPSVHINSPRRRPKKAEGDEQLLFDLKMESEQLIKNAQKPTIIVTHSNMLWTCQKPKSQMQKRYKIKRHQDKTKKQGEERSFTASRSHRKTKPCFN